MFTNTKSMYYGNDRILIEAACLSTDNKPTTGIANGSLCFEMNTGKKYMFDEESGEWVEFQSGGGGGGGGSSDFSTAEVTVVNGTGQDVRGAFISTLPFEPPIDTTFPTALLSNNVVLYKGNAVVMVEAEVASISGDIVDMGDNIYLITGDCTITIS